MSTADERFEVIVVGLTSSASTDPCNVSKLSRTLSRSWGVHEATLLPEDAIFF